MARRRANLLQTRDADQSRRAKWQRSSGQARTCSRPKTQIIPPLLKHLPDPPLALYVRGTLTAQDDLALGDCRHAQGDPLWA